MHIQARVEEFMNDLWNKKNITAIDHLFTDETLIHSPLQTAKGTLAMKEIALIWLEAFPDLHCRFDDWITEENKTLVRWHAHGTHTGKFLEFGPTEKQINYKGVSIYRLQDDRVVEYWGLVDMYGLVGQLQVSKD